MSKVDPLEPIRRRLEWASKERRRAIEAELAAMDELETAVGDDPELVERRETIKRALRGMAEAEAGMSSALEAMEAQLRDHRDDEDPPS